MLARRAAAAARRVIASCCASRTRATPLVAARREAARVLATGVADGVGSHEASPVPVAPANAAAKPRSGRGPAPARRTAFQRSTTRAVCAPVENWATARSRPRSPRVRASSGSASSVAQARAAAGASPGGTSSPVEPSATASGMPPVQVATTGRPLAAASSRATPKPSTSLGLSSVESRVKTRASR